MSIQRVEFPKRSTLHVHTYGVTPLRVRSELLPPVSSLDSTVRTASILLSTLSYVAIFFITPPFPSFLSFSHTFLFHGKPITQPPIPSSPAAKLCATKRRRSSCHGTLQDQQDHYPARHRHCILFFGVNHWYELSCLFPIVPCAKWCFSRLYRPLARSSRRFLSYGSSSPGREVPTTPTMNMNLTHNPAQ